jgi:hypothetical protein
MLRKETKVIKLELDLFDEHTIKDLLPMTNYVKYEIGSSSRNARENAVIKHANGLVNRAYKMGLHDGETNGRT